MAASVEAIRTNNGFLEESYWLAMGPSNTPISTSLHPEFLQSVHGFYIDVGCCSGRGSRELVKHGCKVIGVDLNMRDLSFGKRLNGYDFDTLYVQSFGEQLPFPSETFDGGAIMLGLLGGVGKDSRSQIITESVRCLRSKASVYIAEFSLITDPTALTLGGKRWIDVYNTDLPITSEYGSVRVLNEIGETIFVAHHFREDELRSLLTEHDIEIKDCKAVQVRSVVSGELRNNWNIWGFKH